MSPPVVLKSRKEGREEEGRKEAREEGRKKEGREEERRKKREFLCFVAMETVLIISGVTVGRVSSLHINHKALALF